MREPRASEVEHIRLSIKIISEQLDHWIDPTGAEWEPVKIHLSMAGVKLLALRGLLKIEEEHQASVITEGLPWE